MQTVCRVGHEHRLKRAVCGIPSIRAACGL